MGEPTTNPKPTEIPVRPRAVVLNAAEAGPPSQLYLNLNEIIRVSVRPNAGNIIILVRLRVLKPDGEVQQYEVPILTVGAYTLQVTDIPVSEGWLLSLAVEGFTWSTTQAAAIAVSITAPGSINTGFRQILIRGLLVGGRTLSFPGGMLRSALEGPGVLRVIVGTDPAAGAEISETVSPQARWKFMGMAFTLVTDATVGNRTPRIALDDGASIWALIPANAVLAASGTNRYHVQSIGVLGVVSTNDVAIPIPPDIYLEGGDRIRTSTVGLFAGDNFSAPVYQIEEWIEDVA